MAVVTGLVVVIVVVMVVVVVLGVGGCGGGCAFRMHILYTEGHNIATDR